MHDGSEERMQPEEKAGVAPRSVADVQMNDAAAQVTLIASSVLTRVRVRSLCHYYRHLAGW